MPDHDDAEERTDGQERPPRSLSDLNADLGDLHRRITDHLTRTTRAEVRRADDKPGDHR